MLISTETSPPGEITRGSWLISTTTPTLEDDSQRPSPSWTGAPSHSSCQPTSTVGPLSSPSPSITTNTGEMWGLRCVVWEATKLLQILNKQSTMAWLVSPEFRQNLDERKIKNTWKCIWYIRVRGGENLTPDNDIFQQVSSVFTSKHPTMTNLTKCYRSTLNSWQCRGK